MPNARRYFKSALLHVLDALFPGDRLLRSLAGSRVGSRALASDRQAATMADATVRIDIAQPRDILRPLAAKLTFDHVVLVHQRREPRQFVFVQIAGLAF